MSVSVTASTGTCMVKRQILQTETRFPLGSFAPPLTGKHPHNAMPPPPRFVVDGGVLRALSLLGFPAYKTSLPYN